MFTTVSKTTSLTPGSNNILLTGAVWRIPDVQINYFLLLWLHNFIQLIDWQDFLLSSFINNVKLDLKALNMSNIFITYLRNIYISIYRKVWNAFIDFFLPSNV